MGLQPRCSAGSSWRIRVEATLLVASGAGSETLKLQDNAGAVESENELKNPWERITLPEETLYKATYAGSGTFIISKPKRKASKRRQARLKNPQRGARK
jgi:hypothetical protein